VPPPGPNDIGEEMTTRRGRSLLSTSALVGECPPPSTYGWLRARGEAGTTWSDADFLCTSASRTSGTSRASGLDTLIARMDAEPVRYVKGGFIH
jgi:hypothetical protein